MVVDAGESVHPNGDPGLLPNLTPHPGLEGLSLFQYAAGDLPLTVVDAADDQDLTSLVHHYCSDTY